MKWLDQFENAIENWLTSAPTLRTLTEELRAFAPIAVVGNRAFVTRDDDVREVLANDRAFGVTEVYAERMARTTGAFFLGMENTAQYQREVGIARRAVRSDDAAAVGALASARARELVDQARSKGGVFDAVGELSRLVPLRLVERYFGVPGPDPGTLARWMRSIFWDIFLNPGNDAAVKETARAASAELGPYLRDLVSRRKEIVVGGGAAPDDFVTRLVQQQAADPTIDDDLLCRNIGGVVVGAVDTQSKAMAQALDQLLRRPAALESARRAAVANDLASVRAHLWEALRFNPHNPVLFRRCHADTFIAQGTSRSTLIKAGTDVIVFTLSAMFDPEAVPSPDEFRSDRPSRVYMHFGDGQHTCFGAFLNGIVLPAAMREVLALDGLAYASDGPREIEYEGPFPDRMRLRFDVAR